MEIIEGKRHGSKVYIRNGYSYTLAGGKRSATGTVYLKCTKENCRARAKLGVDIITVQENNQHSHNVDLEDLDSYRLKAVCKRRAEDEATRFRQIFDEERDSFPNARVGFAEIESAMAKRRKASRPPLPRTPEEVVQVFQNYPALGIDKDGRRFYSGHIPLSGGGYVIIFIAPGFTEDHIGEVEEIHMDGTFRVTPHLFDQLISIHLEHSNYVFPFVYALSTHRTMEVYEKLLRFVVGKYPTLSPRLAICDFERAIIGALQTVFPAATVSGCYFHFTQAIWRNVQRLGLENAYNVRQVEGVTGAKKIIRQMMTLALLPVHEIQGAVNMLRIKINEAVERNGNLIPLYQLHQYFVNTWMNPNIYGPNVFSVFGQERRTNNHQESFHSKIREHVGIAHPNFFSFLKSLKEIDKNQARDFDAMMAGRYIRRRKTTYKLNNEQIVRASDRLTRGEITVEIFLSQMSHRGPTVFGTPEEALPATAPRAPTPSEQSDDDLPLIHFVNRQAAQPVAPLAPLEPVVQPPAVVTAEAAPFELEEAHNDLRVPDDDHEFHLAIRSPPIPLPYAPVVRLEPEAIHNIHMLCVVCKMEPKNNLAMPCQHLSVCQECADYLISTRMLCPICRGHLENFIRVYM